VKLIFLKNKQSNSFISVYFRKFDSKQIKMEPLNTDIPSTLLSALYRPHLQDTYKHKGMRFRMLEEVKAKGQTDLQVLEAMRQVPRHFFLDSAFLEHAYQDKAFNIGEGQTISQPSTVAFQTHLLQVKPHDKILEVGTGSGYQTCVLMELGARVTTIEINNNLHHKARVLLKKMGYKKANYVWGDGSQGYSIFAPYDKILVTAGSPQIPPILVDQLAIGGILVIPVGTKQRQEMLRVTKLSQEGQTRIEIFDFYSFVPLLGKDGWQG